jgi:alpha-L-fucosidase
MARYQPSLLFTDGEWDKTSDVWRAPEFLAWLFNESPVKDDIVVNDRWGSDTRSVHGGYFTTEYGKVGSGKDLAAGRKWEENRAIGASFGYNRNEDLSDYMSTRDIVALLVRTVAKGGNLCLDIGPAADGTIPVVMQERLAGVGEWLTVHGEAIYGTTPWKPESATDKVVYTAKGDTIYAFVLEWPKADLQLPGVQLKGGSSITLLAPKRTASWYVVDGTTRVKLPAQTPADTNAGGVWVLKIAK